MNQTKYSTKIFSQKSNNIIKILIIIALSLSLCESKTLYGAEGYNCEIPNKTSINYQDSIILGLIEGITEYIPVSSTGHLLLAKEILGLNSDYPVNIKIDHDLNKKPSSHEINQIDVPKNDINDYSLKQASFAYVIIIQAGAILAVLFLYRTTIINIILGLLGKNEKGLKLGLLILVSFIPAASIGFILNDWIENYLSDNLIVIAAALLIGAFLMFFTESRRKQLLLNTENRNCLIIKKQKSVNKDINDLNYTEALSIGFAQCLALWPGMSRSMITIVAGYWIGLSPKKAAEYSFLLGLITLSAASAYKLLTDGTLLVKNLPIGPMLLGLIVAFISAIYAIKFLVACLNKYGMAPFAWYRICLAAIIIVFFIIQSK